MEYITSLDNPSIKKIREFIRAGAQVRRSGGVWLEGDHLIRAALHRKWLARIWVWNESSMQSLNADALALQGLHGRHLCVPSSLMVKLTSMDSPPQVGAWFDFDDQPVVNDGIHTHEDGLILDRIQDPGNAGTILRSAAAFGFRHVWAVKGTVALWSPKVLRAAMGAHFSLVMREGCSVEDIRGLKRPLTATSSHAGVWLHKAALERPCTWVFGHEGQGISPELGSLAEQWVKIYQPAGEESLNVGVAASICMHSAVVIRL